MQCELVQNMFIFSITDELEELWYEHVERFL